MQEPLRARILLEPRDLATVLAGLRQCVWNVTQPGLMKPSGNTATTTQVRTRSARSPCGWGRTSSREAHTGVGAHQGSRLPTRSSRRVRCSLRSRCRRRACRGRKGSRTYGSGRCCRARGGSTRRDRSGIERRTHLADSSCSYCSRTEGTRGEVGMRPRVRARSEVRANGVRQCSGNVTRPVALVDSFPA